MRSLVGISFALSLSTLAGCMEASSNDPSTGGGDDMLTESSSLLCSDLGRNDPTLLSLKGNQLTIQIRGVASASVGTKVADPAPGFSGYSVPSTDGGPPDTYWVSADGKKVQLHLENVGPFYEGTCRKATAKDLSVDACDLLLRNMGSRATVKKENDASYLVTVPNKRTGDMTWRAKTSGSGFTCTVTSQKAVSCAAIVNDKIDSRARDDGSSAGSPYVNKKSATTWSGGIHDPESGEFSYDITTSSDADGCTITSVKSTAQN